mmetsp:Transcript_5192/g.10333  ORF Transcript_5192/g.10333 Transcript_5192/m.10333 type:complete len:88 (+) Transcript_5192:1170-1433(+)
MSVATTWVIDAMLVDMDVRMPVTRCCTSDQRGRGDEEESDLIVVVLFLMMSVRQLGRRNANNDDGVIVGFVGSFDCSCGGSCGGSTK